MSNEKQMFNDLVDIFAEEHESRGMITPHNTAKKMTEKGYVKQGENTVEIVRCKDCKYARGNLVSIGIIDCLMYRDMRKGEDFCNYGERKEQE